MSQSQFVKHAPCKTLFPLNIRNVNALFPGFAAGDFAVLHGSHSVVSLASLLCVRTQLANQLGGLNSNVIFIDCGNTFRLYQIAKLAQVHQLNPKKVLDSIYISRAFTAYQVTALIMHKLSGAIEKSNAKLVIISDITGYFLDKALSDDEAQRVFSQTTTYISNFARQHQIVLIATCLPHPELKRALNLQTISCTKANMVLSLKQTKHARTVCLEKHPYLKLGSVELPSDNITLTDFMGDSA